MKRNALLCAVILAAVVPLSLAAAPKDGRFRKRRQAERLAQAQPEALSETQPNAVAPPAPVKPQTPPLWHTWSDPQGHTIEAELRAVEGDLITVRTKDAHIYQLNLAKLIPADRQAAEEMQPHLPPPARSVAEAAAKVDGLVLAGLTKAGQSANAPATDEQLVRRLYLDIAGRIPTAQETAAFLHDKAPDKRARLIDRLIGSDGYNSQMFNWLADMLRVMDDYGKGAKSYVYEEWLKEQIAANRPWSGLVHDLLTADGRLTENGPVGYLLRDRKMPLDSLSNTLTTFLGANVACAQCHDHPLAKWTQRDFYEMASFFGATDTEDESAKRKARQLTRTSGLNKVLLLGVATANAAVVEDRHRNTMTFPKDYKYEDAKPGAPVPPKLIHWGEGDLQSAAYRVDTSTPEQLREQFANWLTHPDNPRFAAAIANRLWGRVFGLAVQEPVTDIDDPSKAANPELLAHLASEMKRVQFDLREFQRILFNTQAYQRQASVTPDLGKGPFLFPGPLLRRMTAEQAWDSVLTLVVGPGLDEYKLSRSEKMRRLDIPGAVLTSEALLAKARELKAAYPAGLRRQGKRGPDVTAADYEGEPPPRFEGLTLARASELPQPAKEAHFLRMFGQSDRQVADGGTLEGGVPQVLMMMNGDVQKVIASNASLVLKDAARQPTPERQVESLYFSFLGRRPTIPETATACRSLKDGLGLADLTWVLFNSREFIFVQ